MKFLAALIAGAAALSLVAYAATQATPKDTSISPTIKLAPTEFKAKSDKRERAILAGGCFWGTEKYFRMTPGITATAVGYIGGRIKNPTYQQVSYENTGAAEGIMVEFDPTVITYSQVLDRFWDIHNPCTLNSQGPDFGDQYRSGIYPMNADQEKIAKESKKRAAPLFKRPIVTEIIADKPFYMAEEYHQRYAEKTGRYCAIDRSDHIKP